MTSVRFVVAAGLALAVTALFLATPAAAQDSDSSSSFEASSSSPSTCTGSVQWQTNPSTTTISAHQRYFVAAVWTLSGCSPSYTQRLGYGIFKRNDEQVGQDHYAMNHTIAPWTLEPGVYTVGTEMLLSNSTGPVHRLRRGFSLTVLSPECTGTVQWQGLPNNATLAPHAALDVSVKWNLVGCHPDLAQERRFAVFNSDDEVIREQRGPKLYLPPRSLAPGAYRLGTELLLLFDNGTIARELRYATNLVVGSVQCSSLGISLPAALSIPNDQRNYILRPTVDTSNCENVPYEIVFLVMDPTTRAVVASPTGNVMEVDTTQFSAGESYVITASIFAFIGTGTKNATSNDLVVNFTEGSGSGAGGGGGCDDYIELDGVPDEIRQRSDRAIRIGASLRSGCPLPRTATIAPTWTLSNTTTALSTTKRMGLTIAAGELAAGTYTLSLTVRLTYGGTDLTISRTVSVEITEEVAQLRILGGNRTLSKTAALDFVADGVGVTESDVVWGICNPDLTQSGLKCASQLQVSGITGERGWELYTEAKGQVGSWVIWATAKGARAAVLVTVIDGAVLQTSIFGIPIRPIGAGAPVILFAHADGASSYAWYLNGGTTALSGKTTEELMLTAAEVEAAATANGGTVQVRVVATNGATNGEATGSFKVVKAKQGRCSASGARGFGKITAGSTSMTLKATDFAETGTEVLYAFGYKIGSGTTARDVILGDEFGTAASFNFTAPVLAGRGAASVEVAFFVEAIVASTLDDPFVVPVVASCSALIHRNEKLSTNVTAFAEAADAELDLAEAAGDLGQMLRAMAGVTVMFGEFTDDGTGSAPSAADVARAATMRKNSLGSLRRTFSKGGAAMTAKQSEQVLSTMASLFTDDEDTADDLVDDVSELLGGVLDSAASGSLDMAKLGGQVVKMLLKVPDSAEGNTSRRALSQKAALATATGLRVGQERVVTSGTLTLRATKLPVDAMAKKNVTAGSKQLNVPRAAFGPANLSKSTEVAVSTVDYAAVPLPNATGADKIKNGTSVEIDIVVSNKKRAVSGLAPENAVKIDVTVSGQFVGAAICAFFNGTTGNWSSAGVTTIVAASGVIQCRSTHLSLFAVQDAAQTTTPAPTPAPTPSGAAPVVITAAITATFLALFW